MHYYDFPSKLYLEQVVTSIKLSTFFLVAFFNYILKESFLFSFTKNTCYELFIILLVVDEFYFI